MRPSRPPRESAENFPSAVQQLFRSAKGPLRTYSRGVGPASLYVSPRGGYSVASLETIVGPVAHRDAAHTGAASTRYVQVLSRERLNTIGA